ncbi:unnamed protein product, partial [marine sediment metagenome]
MSRLLLWAGIIILLIICRQTFAQESFLEKSNEKLSSLPYQKIFLHTDRDIYTVKEDIWFKIYLLDGKTHAPHDGSYIGYVDLAGPTGEILVHKPFFLENGLGHGNYTIGDSLETGVYTLCAYTNYMR